jgi:hypothetical protein
MKYFAQSMTKIAQDGLVSSPSPAQVYAARKADEQYRQDIKKGSPSGYANAVAGAIMVPLITPALFSLPSITPDKISKHINTVYVAEAIKHRFPGFGDDANHVAAAIVNSSFDNPITRDVTGKIVKMKFDIAHAISMNGAPGVDKQRGQRIVADADREIKKLLPPGSGKTPRERFDLFDFHMKQSVLQGRPATYQGMLQNKTIFMPELVPGFNSDYAMALTEMGKDFYKRRTGKELTSNAAAIKLIAKAAGNSLKAGVPLALLAGGFAAARHHKSTKGIRDFQRGQRPAQQDPAAIWGNND